MLEAQPGDGIAAIDKCSLPLASLARGVGAHPFWATYEGFKPDSPIGVHLAVFAEPFLSLVLCGRKTVESRFSRNRIAPFDSVDPGDVILLKAVAGPITGVALAERTWYFNLGCEPLSAIRARFSTAICADESFWAAKACATYATIIELSQVAAIPPVSLGKRDRRGWVAVRGHQHQMRLW